MKSRPQYGTDARLDCRQARGPKWGGDETCQARVTGPAAAEKRAYSFYPSILLLKDTDVARDTTACRLP
jgi:hypothetical protein